MSCARNYCQPSSNKQRLGVTIVVAIVSTQDKNTDTKKCNFARSLKQENARKENVKPFSNIGILSRGQSCLKSSRLKP